MPSAVSSDRARPTHDDLDNYGIDEFSDDPFAPDSPGAAKKRKEPADNVAIDEEISVAKRARVPNVKLDDQRLLSENGIPKLRTRAQKLKLKGKGHEFSDASRLLSFYQLWLDDLFPKAKFLDALAMVEKAGHKKPLMAARNEWMNEGKRSRRDDNDEDNDGNDETNSAPQNESSTALRESIEGVGAAAQNAGRLQTPPPRTTQAGGNYDDDVPNDADLYDATPRQAARRTQPIAPTTDGHPDEDDLDALMAEAETHDRPAAPPAPPQPKQTSVAQEPGDEDDLDALMAEAEAHDEERNNNEASGNATTLEAGTKKGAAGGDDFADEEAAMREMDGMW